MANIFNYKSRAAYDAATNRPAQQSSVSYDGSQSIFDGVNVLVPFYETNANIGDAVVYDTVEKQFKLLKWRTYNAGTFESSRYILGRGLYFGSWDGEGLFAAFEDAGSFKFSVGSYFRITGFDLTQAGSFTFNSYHGWADHTGIVISWEEGATYADIVASMAASAINKSYFFPAALADGTGIGLAVEYPTISTVSRIFTITAKSGGAENLAVQYMNQYDGKDVVWQYVETSTIIAGRAKAASVLRRSGLYTSWGGLTPRFKEYYGTSGSATYQNEQTSASPMSKAGFEALATSEVAEQKALYDKYNGNYDEYIEGQKVALDTARGTLGMYTDAKEQTNLLAEIMTLDYDNNVIPAFPGCYAVSHYGVNAGVTTGFEAGNWGLPNTIQLCAEMLAVGYNSNDKTELNEAFDKFNAAGNLYNSNYYMSSAEYSAYGCHFYYGYAGGLNNYAKGNSLRCRGVLALPFLKA